MINPNKLYFENILNKKEKCDFKSNYFDRLWKCRDFELQHLWQLSIFLTAFIVLVFSAYGGLWSEALFMGEKKFSFCNNGNFLLHYISIGLSLLGFIFSVFWIMMGKGSKFWYEVYEKKIKEFELRENCETYSVQYIENALGGIPQNSSLFFNKHAYQYSVSGINILIGQVLAFVWSFLLIVHAFVIFSKTNLSLIVSKDCPYFGVIIISVVVICFLSIIISLIRNILRNDILDKIAELYDDLQYKEFEE